MLEQELKTAIRERDVSRVRDLVRQGAALDADLGDHVPITLAAVGYRREIVKLLMELGCDVDKSNRTGYTALHFAALNGDREIAKVLLENGAAVDARNDKGETPLMLAAFHVQGKICHMLIERGADVNARRLAGMSVLRTAAMLEGKRAVKIVQMLISAGARLDETPEPALITACSEAHIDAIEALVVAGSDVNARDSHGWTPLMVAAFHNRRDVIQMLLQHGADAAVRLPATAKNYPDCTAKDIAMDQGHGAIAGLDPP